jgi:SsrA-binding protein
MAQSEGKARHVIARNKKAFFNFTVEETLEVGIELQGTEVKSIKANRVSFTDSYARIRNDELWLFGLHIAEYTHGNLNNHEPDRTRKLLAHKGEIKRLRRKIDERGYTMVPLRIYVVHGLIKVEVGLCKGKKVHDKREAIKKRDQKRDEARELRNQY